MTKRRQPLASRRGRNAARSEKNNSLVPLPEGYSTVWFVPPDDDDAVVELAWNDGEHSSMLAEIAHDAAKNVRLLCYWVPGATDPTELPLFELLSVLTQANALLIGSRDSSNLRTGGSAHLELRAHGPDSFDILLRGSSMSSARVTLDITNHVVLEIWEPDEHPALRLPLHDVMLALFVASIRLDRVTQTLDR